MGALFIDLLFSGLEIATGIWEERREKRKRKSARSDGRERSFSQAATSGRKS